MTAKELIDNNSLTNIEVSDGQMIVFTDIALTAISMAREEVRQKWEKATGSFVKDAEKVMKQRAIEAHWKCCPNLSRDNDRMCKHIGDCDRSCLYMDNFINQLLKKI